MFWALLVAANNKIARHIYIMKEVSKIKLIEAPLNEQQEIFREELEEALGGWNCGSFDMGTCYSFDDNNCSNNNYTRDCNSNNSPCWKSNFNSFI